MAVRTFLRAHSVSDQTKIKVPAAALSFVAEAAAYQKYYWNKLS